MPSGITATIMTGKDVMGTKTGEVALPKDIPTPTLLGDPIIQLLTWVVALVALIVSVGKPIKDYLRGEHREDKRDKVTDAKANAESFLYDQFSSQIAQYRQIADTAYKERNDLIQRVGALEAKAEDLEEQKKLVDKLKDRLDSKDEQIRQLLEQAADERKQFFEVLRAKDEEITRRDARILDLERGLRELELRLSKEERIVNTFVCPVQERINRKKETKADGIEGINLDDLTKD